MHNMQVKMKFIQLKAEGIPMYKIARALGVHRTTLTLWHKELADFILIAKQDYIDELLYENNNTKLSRIEAASRHIFSLYRMLDEPWNLSKAGMTYSEVLTLIMKYTKLLHMEYNEKPIERLIKSNERKRMDNSVNNPKEKENNENITKEEKKETPVWITDMEAFIEVQPLENNPEEIIVDKEWYGLDIELGDKMEALRDISEEEPEIQKIFNRTYSRTMVGEKREVYLKESDEYYKSLEKEEPDKNDKSTASKSVKNSSNDIVR